MGIEGRLGKHDLSNIGRDSDSRAALHSQMSHLADEMTPQSIKDITCDDAVLPVDHETTRKLLTIRNAVYEISQKRDIVSLSPVGPFGLNSFLTKTSSLKVSHATGRNVDVVADPTTELAVEAFRRRRNAEDGPISLGTFHRCFRLQRYVNTGQESYTSHFEMFGTLDTSNVAEKGKNFSMDAVASLVSFYTQLFSETKPALRIEAALSSLIISERLLKEGYTSEKSLETAKLPLTRVDSQKIEFESLHAALDRFGLEKDIRQLQVLMTMVKQQNPSIKVSADLTRTGGIGHYSGLAFSIYAPDGIDIVDGGSVDWVSKMTSNRRDWAVVSGMGTELFAKSYM